MEQISGRISGAMYPPPAAADVKAAPKIQQSEDKTQDRPTAPARDVYIPEEKQEPSGRYRLGKDENGQLKVYIDDPKRATDAPEKQADPSVADDLDQGKKADAPAKKASDDKAENCTCNTDKVDREIEKLKKKREELEHQIHSETDDAKIKELEKELAQVENELRQKDNDTYRRQHATIS